MITLVANIFRIVHTRVFPKVRNFGNFANVAFVVLFAFLAEIWLELRPSQIHVNWWG